MAISILQAAQNSIPATSTTIALAFGSAVTAGSYIYVAAVQVDTNGITATCADSLNGAYAAALDSLNVGGGCQLYQFASPASLGGANTVTVTFSPTATFRGIFIAEIAGSSGLDTTGTYHSAALTSSGTSVSSGTLTPSVANGLAIGAYIDGNLAAITISPGAGFTDISTAFTSSTFWQFTTGANHGDAAYQIYSTTASVPVTFTLSGSDNLSGACGALFKPAAAGNTASIAWVS
jgi:hypothetical protein